MEFDELSNRVIAGLLMNFNVTKLKSGIKRFVSPFVLFVSFVVK